MNRTNFPQRKAQRIADGELRAEERATRSDEEQLALLDLRPGNSCKERARLEANIEGRAAKSANQQDYP